MPSVKPSYETFAKIKVVGVGGSGGKAVAHMANTNLRGVELAAINTDAQDLHHIKVPQKLHIGKKTTRGLGAGMNPEVGRQAADESREDIRELLQGADMVFVTGGLGGGTCSGAAPVVAELAREAGALTVSVITRPFSFEGRQRTRIAQEAWDHLRRQVDAVVTIDNDRILDVVEKETPLLHAFKLVNEVLRNAVAGIAEIITVPGLINVDFADVKSVMNEAGIAHMGIGKGSGENRMLQAAKTAVSSPLVDSSMKGARGILFSVAGGTDMTMQEIHEAAKLITEEIDPEARIIFGAVIDRSLPKKGVRVTVVGTGLGPERSEREKPSEAQEALPLNARSGPRALRSVEIAANGASSADRPEHNHSNAEEEEDPFEIPAFIRRKLSQKEEDEKES